MSGLQFEDVRDAIDASLRRVPIFELTLRDYFAAQAMIGILTDKSVAVGETALCAYSVADAMLKERAK